MVAFIDIAYLKSLPLGVKDSLWPTDPELTTLIETASEHLQGYLDRVIVHSTITERTLGEGGPTLILDEYPITALTSVTKTGPFSTTSYPTSAFFIHSKAGLIEFIDTIHNEFGRGSIFTVVYQAGYTTIPAPIKHATALQVLEFMKPQYGGIMSQNIEFVPETTQQIVDLLEDYKRKRFV